MGLRVERDTWAFVGPVTAWTNGFLQPPPPHVAHVLMTAAAEQALADAIADGFARPVDIVGYSHVSLSVRDRDRSSDWYCRVFGFEVFQTLEEPQYVEAVL